MFFLTNSQRFALIVIALLFAAAGCYGSGVEPIPAPATGIQPKELLLDTQPFPEGWQVSPCEPYCENAERSSEAFRSFGVLGVSGHVNQQVFHFADVEGARWKFDRYEETTPHSPPSGNSYRSPIAEDQFLRCGVDGVPSCRASLLYGSYFVYFYFSLGPGNDAQGNMVEGHGLDLDDVERILRAMDERYAELSGIPLPTE